MRNVFTLYGSIFSLVIITLFIIHFLDISIPFSIVSTTKSSELAVVGEGRVDVTPNTAVVNAGIIASGTTVDQVKKTINDTNNAILDSLQKIEVSKKDIKTTNYSVSPAYSYDGGVNIIKGYNGNVNLAITTRNTNLTAQITQEVTSAGANQVSVLYPSVENPELYREQAREKAIENAKQQAQKLATNLGIKLGKIVNIVESDSGSPLPRPMAMKALDAGVAQAPVIELGTETITSVVTLYFERK